jgi:hypothetical protein
LPDANLPPSKNMSQTNLQTSTIYKSSSLWHSVTATQSGWTQLPGIDTGLLIPSSCPGIVND